MSYPQYPQAATSPTSPEDIASPYPKWPGTAPVHRHPEMSEPGPAADSSVRGDF